MFIYYIDAVYRFTRNNVDITEDRSSLELCVNLVNAVILQRIVTLDITDVQVTASGSLI